MNNVAVDPMQAFNDYSDAAKIVRDVRIRFSGGKDDNPILWGKLYRVGRYVEKHAESFLKDALGDPEKERSL